MGFSLDYFVGADGAHVFNVGTTTTGQFGVEKFRIANLAVTCAVPLNVSSISSTVQITTPNLLCNGTSYLGGSIMFKDNVWHISNGDTKRLYYGYLSTTYYSGGSNTSNNATDNFKKLRVGNHGRAVLTRCEYVRSPGPPGLPGPQGKDGKMGRAGFSGDPGARGDIGAQGSAGGYGAPGKFGQPGKPGMSGKMGEEGPQGRRGYQGKSGARGDFGRMGAPGGEGDPGDLGMKTFGPDGPTGPRGSRGFPGPSGPPGKNGPPADPPSEDSSWPCCEPPPDPPPLKERKDYMENSGVANSGFYIMANHLHKNARVVIYAGKKWQHNGLDNLWGLLPHSSNNLALSHLAGMAESAKDLTRPQKKTWTREVHKKWGAW
jgi:hypothetical protein